MIAVCGIKYLHDLHIFIHNIVSVSKLLYIVLIYMNIRNVGSGQRRRRPRGVIRRGHGAAQYGAAH